MTHGAPSWRIWFGFAQREWREMVEMGKTRRRVGKGTKKRKKNIGRKGKHGAVSERNVRGLSVSMTSEQCRYHVSRCREKSDYDSQEEAYRGARWTMENHGVRVFPYECPFCGKWHLTKNPWDDDWEIGYEGDN